MKNLFQTLLRIIGFGLILFLSACDSYEVKTISYDEFKSFIKVPKPGEKADFDLETAGISKTIICEDSIEFSGYATGNSEFFSAVIDPVLQKYLDELKSQNRVDAINNLTLFSHEVYQNYFGKGFYRWGGDIFDLDHPQEKGSRFDKKYGLDCSGFVNMPYELAVYYGILDSLNEVSAFSSKGFKIISEKTGLKDGGGRKRTSNNFRIDTHDIFNLGRLVTTIERGTIPSDEQMALLQPGDMVGRAGHVGIIVKINNDLYYLESGGRVLPNNGYNPADARMSLAIFAERRPVYVRRCLPDYN